MKKLYPFIMLLIIPFLASGQFTFEWESQLIKEDFNMKEMSVMNNNNALLVGYGNTFMKTTDQGTTWEKIPLIDPEYYWEDISINSSGLGYAVSGDARVVDNAAGGEPDVYADGVLLKTTDFGATWIVVDITTIGQPEDDPADYPAAEGCFSRRFWSVEVLEDNTVYLSAQWKFFDGGTSETTYYSGTFKSTDGTNWVPVQAGDTYSIFIEAGTAGIYFGGYNHLFRGETGNDNVTDIYPALTSAAADGSIVVDDVAFAADEILYVVTSQNGIFVTEDKGATFTLLENGAPAGGDDIFLVNDTVWMVLGTTSKSMITRDSGATWENCSPGEYCFEIGGILNDSIIGLSKSNIYKLAVNDAIEGDYAWKTQLISPDVNLRKMNITDDNNAIMVGYMNTLVSTSNAGISWDPLETPELHVYGGVYGFESVSTSGSASYAVTSRLSVVDFPASSDYSDLYAHGLIFKTTDNWDNWELLDYRIIGSGPDPSLNPNAEGCYGMLPYEVACLDASTAFVYVTWMDTITDAGNRIFHGNVFRTKDGGATWTALFEDLGSSYINHILFPDANTGYIVGNSFFRKTTDGGNTFTDLYPSFKATGSPDGGDVFLRYMEYVDEQTWYMLSSVDGVSVTTDGGATYKILPGIGGGNGIKLLNDSTIIVLGSNTKSKISWDYGTTWHNCYPGSTIWGIGGILNDQLVALAKSSLYKIPLADLEAPSSAAEILTFSLDAQTGDAVIDPGNGTISIEVETGTDLTALSPAITISEGATVSPSPGTAQDFTGPLTYTVTAEDLATSRDWIVTVTVAVGISQAETAITLYPNPVAANLYLGNLEAIDRIKVSNITGSTILEMETPAEVATLDMSKYKNGIYFISLIGRDGTITSRKFVINK